MDELMKALKDFIMRDVLYIVGGGTVGLAFCYFLHVTVPRSPSTAVALLAAGIAYGVGYAIQDGLSLLRIVTTAPVVQPKPIVRFLYRRFKGTGWERINCDDFDAVEMHFRTIASDREYAQWNRIVAQKQIGTTLGSCDLVAGLVLVVEAVRRGGDIVTVTLAATSLILSLTLLGLSWVKGAQQSQFVVSVVSIHKRT